MFKLVYVINLLIDSNLISKLIFYISVSLMFILTYLLLKNNLINFLPLFIIIFLTSLVEKTYQEYFDPIIIVLLFSYFTFEQNIIEIRSKNVVKSYLIFFLCFWTVRIDYLIYGTIANTMKALSEFIVFPWYGWTQSVPQQILICFFETTTFLFFSFLHFLSSSLPLSQWEICHEWRGGGDDGNDATAMTINR